MLAYRYPERKDDAETSRDRFELPLKKDDHGPEALGRFFAGRFGPGSLSRNNGTQVKKAKMGRMVQRKTGLYVPDRGKPLSAMRPTDSGYQDKSWRQNFGVISDEELRQ
jgi:hypothetical protein